MFINAMGLILADHNKIQLGELTYPRALGGIPFGGRYRIIDFMLSNMVNSGINTIGVVAMNKYRSLMDHLGSGSSWDLNRKTKGLHLLLPYIGSASSGKNGELGDLPSLLDYFKSNKQKYVIIANSNIIFNTTLNDFVQSHEEKGADISLMYNRDGTRYGSPSTIVDLDRRGFVSDMLENPAKPTSTRCLLGVIIMARELLIDLVSEAISRDEHDFSMQSLLRRYANYRVYGYEYKGVALRFNSVATYFASSMQLLDEKIRRELFLKGLPVYTKVKDEGPALYSDETTVSNSLISDGCQLIGSVTDSLLFRNVTISRNAKIKNSIIFQYSYISEGVELENVILDKNCMIRPGVKLVGQSAYPVVIGKGAIV